MQICSILRFSWSILVKCCVHLRTSSSNIQMLGILLEKYIYHKFWLFCYRFIALIFDLCSVLTYVCCLKQWLEQLNYSDVQSMLMTRFWTDFMSSVWNFCRWVADVPSRETSSAAKNVASHAGVFREARFSSLPCATKNEEKRMFSQANLSKVERLR